MPSRRRLSAPIVRAVGAVALALLLTGCGSSVQTTIGSPQNVNSALPTPPKGARTNFPEIATRFVLPRLTPAQKRFVRAYVDWSVATLTSMRSGRMDPRVRKLSSATTFQTVQKQVAQAAAGGGTWKRIVERIQQVGMMGVSSAFGVCMAVTTDAGATTRISLVVQMAERSSGWYVFGSAVSPTKLPNC